MPPIRCSRRRGMACHTRPSLRRRRPPSRPFLVLRIRHRSFTAGHSSIRVSRHISRPWQPSWPLPLPLPSWLFILARICSSVGGGRSGSVSLESLHHGSNRAIHRMDDQIDRREQLGIVPRAELGEVGALQRVGEEILIGRHFFSVPMVTPTTGSWWRLTLGQQRHFRPALGVVDKGHHALAVADQALRLLARLQARLTVALPDQEQHQPHHDTRAESSRCGSGKTPESWPNPSSSWASSYLQAPFSVRCDPLQNHC